MLEEIVRGSGWLRSDGTANGPVLRSVGLARGRVRVMVVPRSMAGARGGDVSAVLAGDVADEEEAEAGALDSGPRAAGDAVEALEDALELVGGQAEAGVGDA